MVENIRTDNNDCDSLRDILVLSLLRIKNNPCVIVFATHGPALSISPCLLQLTLFKVDLIHINSRYTYVCTYMVYSNNHLCE